MTIITIVTTTTIDQLPALVGVPLGPSSWLRIEQPEVTAFSALTRDDNPLHTDVEFAATTPFGVTIVHGYFTLSLIVPLLAEVLEITDLRNGVNYGIDRLRFPAPVPVGSRVRLTSTSTELTAVPEGVQAHHRVVVEVEGGAKPALAADLVVRYYR